MIRLKIPCLFTGLGFGFLFISSNQAVGQCFQGQASLVAVSVGACAVGVGSMGYPYLVAWLMTSYSLKGTFLILGGITLNSIPLVLTWNSSEKKSNMCNCTDDSEQDIQRKSSCGICASAKEVFKYMPYPFAMVGISLGVAASMVFDIVALDIVESVGMSRDQSVSAYVALKAAGIPGRLIPGLISKIPRCSSVMAPIAASLFAAIGIIVLNHTTGFIGNVNDEQHQKKGFCHMHEMKAKRSMCIRTV